VDEEEVLHSAVVVVLAGQLRVYYLPPLLVCCSCVLLLIALLLLPPSILLALLLPGLWHARPRLCCFRHNSSVSNHSSISLLLGASLVSFQNLKSSAIGIGDGVQCAPLPALDGGQKKTNNNSKRR
jgi:hypothetical protein